MLCQNRPFFRKLLKLKHPIKKTIFVSSNSVWRASNGQKLTVHKFKNLNNNNLVSPSVLFSLNYPTTKVSSLDVSSRGIIHSSLLVNYLGVKFISPTVKGNWINEYWVAFRWQDHHIYSLTTMKFNLNTPSVLSTLSFKSKKIGLLSFLTGTLDFSGLLTIKVSKKNILLYKSSFFLGMPSKDKSTKVGITSRVRSIAKNPVDHPNGGRANTKGSFKTPWGSIAKHNK